MHNWRMFIHQLGREIWTKMWSAHFFGTPCTPVIIIMYVINMPLIIIMYVIIMHQLYHTALTRPCACFRTCTGVTKNKNPQYQDTYDMYIINSQSGPTHAPQTGFYFMDKHSPQTDEVFGFHECISWRLL